MSEVHPTQKPVALMGVHDPHLQQRGRDVLDFAMGSGTTGVACEDEVQAAVRIGD